MVFKNDYGTRMIIAFAIYNWKDHEKKSPCVRINGTNL